MVHVFICQKHSTESLWKAAFCLSLCWWSLAKDGMISGVCSPLCFWNLAQVWLHFPTATNIDWKDWAVVVIMVVVVITIIMLNSWYWNLAADLLGFLRGSVQLSLCQIFRFLKIVCIWLFWGGCMDILLLLLSYLLWGSGSAAVSLENINACKHFSKGITSSCTYFIIFPQIWLDLIDG